MRGVQLVGVLAISLLLAVSGAQAAPAIGACWMVHGKVFLANGTPSLRIAPTGSSSIYGVLGKGGAGEFDLAAELPPALARISPDAYWSRRVTADITVCPLTKHKAGAMQRVAITGARNVLGAAR